MKHIKEYKYFITNEGRSLGRTTEITEEDFNRLLEENCTHWEQNKKVPILRGLSSNIDYGHIDPKEHTRKSIEEENIHVTYMSQSDAWRSWPNYENSVIGIVGSEFQPKSYGSHTFEVIPYDDAHIAIGPDSNIWSCFGGFESNEGIRLVYFFLESIGIYGHEQEDWGHIMDRIDKISEFPLSADKEIHFTNKLVIRNDVDYDRFMAELQKRHKGEEGMYSPQQVIDHIKWIFRPDTFRKIRYDSNWLPWIKENYMDYIQPGYYLGNQVWTESECLLKLVK